MSTVTIKLNGAPYTVEAGSTILEAAASVGVRIPSLCYLKDQKVKANCRVCLVEVKGSRTLQPACAVKVSEGMEIQTDTPEVRQARRTSLQLILSHHPIDCQSCVRLESSHLEDLSKELCSMCFYCDCVRDGDCELQKLVEEYNINHLDFPWEQKQLKEDHSTPSIVKNPNKCILCRRCVEACSGQGIGIWHVTGRGNKAQVTTAFNRPLAATDCVECGQCVRSCPVGALYESQDYDSILDAAATGRHQTVTARIEPWFLERYLELAELDPQQYGLEHLLAGLKRIGVDRVVKNGFAEEEAARQISEELKHAGGKPVISALCPASVQFVEKKYPELVKYLSKVPSPQQLFSLQAKQEDPSAYTVSLSLCSARKMEASKPWGSATDLVMSPREINRTFVRSGADPTALPPLSMDEVAGAEGINLVCAAEEKSTGVVETVIQIDGVSYKAAAAYGLKAVAQLLDQLAQGVSEYAYIQLQACPHGCRSTNAWLV